MSIDFLGAKIHYHEGITIIIIIVINNGRIYRQKSHYKMKTPCAIIEYQDVKYDFVW